MNERYVIGIDPGKTGAAVLISYNPENKEGIPEVEEIVRFKEGYDKLRSTIHYVYTLGNRLSIYLEKVWGTAFGPQSFSFGEQYGIIKGLLLSSGFTNDDINYVAPVTWMRELDSLTGGDKNVSVKTAKSLFPAETIKTDTADAFLIAYYGMLQELKK